MACSLSGAWRASAAIPVASARSIHALSNKKRDFPENERNPGNLLLPRNATKPGDQNMVARWL